jgi:thiol-disulfide isomerase/thioredoxin
MELIKHIIELTNPDHLTQLKAQYSDALFIVFFYTHRCPNCKQLKPNYEHAYELLKEEGYLAEYSIIFTQVLTSVVPELLKKHIIMGVPTVIFLKNDELIYRFSGVTDYGRLTKKIKDLIEVTRKFVKF